MINKKYHLIIIILFTLCYSCTKKTNNNSCELKSSGKITLPLDKNTYYFSKAIFLYTDSKTGKEYLSFENNNSIQQEIIIWSIDSLKLIKKIQIAREGPNGLQLKGHYMKSLDSIYVTTVGQNIIALVNDKGCILQKIKCEKSTTNEPVSSFSSISILYHPIVLVGTNFYLKQSNMQYAPSGDDWARTPLNAKVDTLNHVISFSLLKHPRFWEKNNPILNSINIDASYEYDGNNFIYSFCKLDSIIVTKDHTKFQKYETKSKYLSNVKCELENESDIMGVERSACKQSTYWHFVYDKYRDVYYRFAFLPCELEPNDNPMDVELHRQKFSVIILNNKFEVIGETLFPKDKYSPKMFFVGKKGLYISESNPKNPEFDENKLVFSCFTLAKKI